jgi:hypothetical protein
MGETNTTTGDRHEPGRYEIRLKGHLDQRWAAWFDGLSLSRETDGTTTIHSVTCVERDPAETPGDEPHQRGSASSQ